MTGSQVSPDNDKQLIHLSTDLEFAGQLNRCAGHGAKFSLLLAMLSQDMLNRPAFEKDKAENEAIPEDIAALSVYPPQPLKPSEQTWQHLNTNKKLVHTSLKDAQLWQSMHPEPLSLYNDTKRLADEVVQNCGYHTQLKLVDQAPFEEPIEPDATGLYDVLESLQEQPLLA